MFLPNFFFTVDLKVSNNLVNLNKRHLNTINSDINKSSDESVLNNIEEFEAKTSNTIEESEPSIEKVVSIDEQDPINHPFSIAQARNSRSTGWNPTVETHSLLMVDGEPFNKLPIVYISATGNNTILTLTDCNGLTLYSTSAVGTFECGSNLKIYFNRNVFEQGACGFKNTRKSTAIAGQAAGLAMSDVGGL